jgi:hypothetical protein
MAADIIRATTAEEITVEDNMIITGKFTLQGTITGGNSNPFWCVGHVASNGTVGTVLSNNKGRYTFGCSRVQAGLYTITPTTSFPNALSIVNATCHADGANATVRVVAASISSDSFQLITYLNNYAADCKFNLTVIS